MKTQLSKKTGFPFERLSSILHNSIWIFTIAFLMLFTNAGKAQNVGVNTTTPDASAMLDVVSTSSGILVPRLTMVQRDAIVLPATSLLIYQSDNTPGYYYNSGTPAAPAWVMIGGGAAGEWTDAGDYLYPNENTSAQVWEDNNMYGFYYSGLAEIPGYFRSTAPAGPNIAVYGNCNNTDGFGTGGIFTGGDTGVEGFVNPTGSSSYFGVYGSVDGGMGNNYGVYGQALSGNRNYGVFGNVDDEFGYGVYATNSDDNGTAIFGIGNGITGSYPASGSGVAGSSSNIGVYGYGSTATASSGVYGTSDATDGIGSVGISENIGVFGAGGTTSNSWGVYGISNGPDGVGCVGASEDIGVYGVGGTTSASTGVYGRSEATDGVGILSVGNGGASFTVASGAGGVFNGNDGAYAYGNIATGTGLIAVGNDATTVSTITAGTGVAGTSTVAGVYGYGDDAGTEPKGVYGASDAVDGIGVFGVNGSAGVNAYAIYGQVGDGNTNNVDAAAILGFNREQGDDFGYGGYFSAEYAGIYAENRTLSSGYAGIFIGNTISTGDVGGATKSFIIDNPANPENEVLRHTSIESDEAMVIYRGKIKLDANGEAVVEMASYFKSLTKEDEATVQITCVGRPFGIGYEWNADFTSFVVYGDAEREISWMVMADRDDPYMQANRKPVITPKDGDDKGYKNGFYLHPEVYGQPTEKSYNYLWNTKDRKFPSANETTETEKVKTKTQNIKEIKSPNLETQVAKPIEKPKEKNTLDELPIPNKNK